MHSVGELFCSVDNFCQVFEHQWQSQLIGYDLQVRKRKRSLSLNEIMTILIGFHQLPSSFLRADHSLVDAHYSTIDDRPPSRRKLSLFCRNHP